jgi:hypothetical protein
LCNDQIIGVRRFADSQRHHHFNGSRRSSSLELDGYDAAQARIPRFPYFSHASRTYARKA